MAMAVMDLPPFMCLRLIMAMATALPTTTMATTSMATARGTLRLSLDMAMPPATPTDLPRVFLDTMAAMAMVVMDMAATMERGTLRLSLDMAMALLPTIPMVVPALSTEAPRV